MKISDASVVALHLQRMEPASIKAVSSVQAVSYLSYLTVGALSVVTWDILNTCRRDFRLVRTSERGLLAWFIIFISRASTLSTLLIDAIFQVIPSTSCRKMHEAQTALSLISMSTTSLIILLRVRSVFQRDAYLTGTFTLLWMLLNSALSTLLFGTAAVDVSQEKPCLINSVASYVSASFVGPLIYISFAYIFVSARLVSDAKIDMSHKHGMGYLIFGELMPILSKGLLDNGQAYYLTVIIFQLVSLIFFIASTSTSIQFILMDSSIALMNIMICRVHRDSLEKEDDERRRKAERIILLPHVYDQGGSGFQSHTSFSGIQVTKTVEQFGS